MHYLYYPQKNIYFYLQNLLVYIYTFTKGTFILDRTWQCTRHNEPHNATASTEKDRASYSVCPSVAIQTSLSVLKLLINCSKLYIRRNKHDRLCFFVKILYPNLLHRPFFYVYNTFTKFYQQRTTFSYISHTLIKFLV